MAKRVSASELCREERVSGFREVAGGLRAQMAVVEAGRCLLCENPPCEAGCPAGVEIRQFLRMMRSKNFRGALKVIRERNPLPATCARVCPQSHLCEGKCSSSDLAEPIAIGLLQRFIADEGLRGAPASDTRPPTGRRVAVVGAGPSGLACAEKLATRGHDVTVFEARALAGGLLAYGIPPYRLPRDVLFKEIDIIRSLGVTILTGRSVADPAGLRGEGFDAVFVACGLWGASGTQVPGCDLVGVTSWIDFLAPLNEALAAGEAPPLLEGARVVVIGGGNAAIDCARSAVRLGARASIFYRRVEPDMPAWDEERSAARAEGVELECCAAPIEYLGGEGAVKGVRFIRTAPGAPDASGRCAPVPCEGTEFVVPCDKVVEAVGLAIDGRFLPGGILKRNLIEVRDSSHATALDGVFAGGDAVNGGATVVRAVADGVAAAAEIDAFLLGS